MMEENLSVSFLRVVKIVLNFNVIVIFYLESNQK